MTTEIVSTHFETLKTADGTNRIIIDTDEEPWNNTMCDNGTVNTIDMIFINIKTIFELHLDAPDQPDKLMAFLSCKKLYDREIGGIIGVDVVNDDDEVTKLWRSVAQIEAVLHEFVKLCNFIELLSNNSYNVERYLEMCYLLDFVRLHTKGRFHVLAKKMLFNNSSSFIEVVSTPPKWKCPVCCEGGRNAHMSIEKSCGHIFHVSCILKLRSPECPCCRQLDDFCNF